MSLIDFCVANPSINNRDNILKYTNIDFNFGYWPGANCRTGKLIYDDLTVIKHLMKHAVNIYNFSYNHQYTIFFKCFWLNDWHISDSTIYMINKGYYLYNVNKEEEKSIVQFKLYKYAEQQKYIKDLKFDKNYYPKNVIKYQYMLVLLMWIIKYHKISSKHGLHLPTVIIKHIIIPLIYS